MKNMREEMSDKLDETNDYVNFAYDFKYTYRFMNTFEYIPNIVMWSAINEHLRRKIWKI